MNPPDEPVLMLDDIQGNVIPGFKKDHQHFLFFLVTDAAPARACLSQMHARISTASEVLDSHRAWKSLRARLGHDPDTAHFIFLNIAFSASGLRLLTKAKEVDEGFEDDAFKQGLSQDRSELIGDPHSGGDAGHQSKWVVGGPSNPVHGTFIMASDDLSWLEESSKKLTDEVSARGMKIVHVDRGDVHAAPTPGHEHFGFRDLISQPAVRGRWHRAPHDFVSERTFPAGAGFDAHRLDFAKPGSPLIWPGHFLFGYGRQALNPTKSDPVNSRKYDPANSPGGPVWAKQGSFMVYRRLKQRTAAFSQFLERAAKSLTGKTSNAPDSRRLAALMIGRWPPGTPVARSPDKFIPMEGDALNYFGYDREESPALPGDGAKNAADPDGLRCPVTAHIRKVNPRDQATDQGAPQNTLTRQILRRGITYDAGEQDKGLLFVAYQSSIVDQFEFLMQI